MLQTYSHDHHVVPGVRPQHVAHFPAYHLCLLCSAAYLGSAICTSPSTRVQGVQVGASDAALCALLLSNRAHVESLLGRLGPGRQGARDLRGVV